MSGYKRIYLFAALSLGFAAAFRSSTYLILGRFIDALVSDDDIGNYIPWIAVSFLVLAVFLHLQRSTLSFMAEILGLSFLTWFNLFLKS